MTRRCAVPDAVDHAVQDTFLAVWREAGTYRGSGDVAAFIWGIGIRRLIDVIRRENGARRRPLLWRAAKPEVVASAEDQVLVGLEHGRLGQALAGLSPELRGVIVLLQGQVHFTGTPAELAATAAGRVWAAAGRDPRAHLSWRGGDNRWRHVGDGAPAGAELVAPTVKDGYLLLSHAAGAR